jgi:hypothetical protein
MGKPSLQTQGGLSQYSGLSHGAGGHCEPRTDTCGIIPCEGAVCLRRVVLVEGILGKSGSYGFIFGRLDKCFVFIRFGIIRLNEITI